MAPQEPPAALPATARGTGLVLSPARIARAKTMLSASLASAGRMDTGEMVCSLMPQASSRGGRRTYLRPSVAGRG